MANGAAGNQPIAAGTPEAMPRLGDVPWFVLGSAGVVIAAVPLLILLVIFQKQLVRGLTTGAVKG